jgi:chromosome segregation ATPase
MVLVDRRVAAGQLIDAQDEPEMVWQEDALPPEIAEEAARAGGELTAHCQALALTLFRQVIGPVRSQHRANLEKLEAERVALLEQVAKADASTHAAKVALSDTLADLERTREVLTAAHSSIALSEERARAAEEQRELDTRESGKQIAALWVQIETLGGTMQQAQRNAAFATIEVRRLEEQVAALTASAEAAQREAASAVAEKRTAQSRADKAEWDRAAMDGELTRLRDKVAQLTSALRVSHDLVTATRAEIAATRSENAASQQRADKAEHALVQAHEEQEDGVRTVTADIIYLT